MYEIDGSMLEGGGQVLRMAIAYAAIIGKSVRVHNIRSRRSEPGLRPQHLTAVKAVAELCSAEVESLKVGSSQLLFKPGPIAGGRHRFDIGTAGSIGLLLQCVTPVAAFAQKPTSFEVIGGTSVARATPVLMLREVVWKALKQMGFRGELVIKREGFYPRGGGVVNVSISPLETLKPIRASDKVKVTGINGLSLSGRLPSHVAERQATSAKKLLVQAGYKDIDVQWKTLDLESPPLSPGSLICLWARSDAPCFIGSDSLGQRGRPAEEVGRAAAHSLLKELETGCSTDLHTADNLIIWYSLAKGESIFTTSELTLHTLTAIKLAETLTDARFVVDGILGRPALIRCQGAGLKP